MTDTTTLAAATNHDAAWRDWRRRGLGGSDAPAIAGVHPFRSAMSVWLEKTGRLDQGAEEEDEPQRWGHLMEDAVVREFEQRVGLPVRWRQAMRTARPPLPTFMQATVDGVVCEDSGERLIGEVYPDHRIVGLFEGKTASRRAWEWDDGVPDHVQVQVQHNLAVTGLDHAWVACLVLVPVPRLRVYELDRDEGLIGELVRIESFFWNVNVLGDLMPAVDASESTGEALREAWRAGGGGEVELDPLLVAAHRTAKAEVADAESRLAQAENALLAALGAAELGRVDGRVAVTYKAHKRTGIDLEALRKRRPEVAREFERTTTYRQLRFPAQNRGEE